MLLILNFRKIWLEKSGPFKHSKVKKHSKERKQGIRNSVDSSNVEGADTLKTTATDDMDIDSFKGDDTLESVEKKENTTQKKNKKKAQEWTKPKRKPTLDEERKLFGKALEIMLVTCMDNHVYQFDDKIRVQEKGGPIGLKLTGEIFDCIMIDWDKQLLEKLTFRKKK